MTPAPDATPIRSYVPPPGSVTDSIDHRLQRMSWHKNSVGASTAAPSTPQLPQVAPPVTSKSFKKTTAKVKDPQRKKVKARASSKSSLATKNVKSSKKLNMGELQSTPTAVVVAAPSIAASDPSQAVATPASNASNAIPKSNGNPVVTPGPSKASTIASSNATDSK